MLFRSDSDFMTVQKIVKSEILGELLNFEIHYNRFKPVLNPKKWKEVVSPANGILYDLGAHIIDQSIVLFGDPLLPRSARSDEYEYGNIWGQNFAQRAGSEVKDAFDIRLDYGRLKVTLRSSLMVREETPRYILHGTKGSFIKYGIDLKEDHLKADIMPNMPTFGIESLENWGTLNTEINGLHITGKVETEVGNWGILFQNIYEVIAEGKESSIKQAEILAQLRIIEQVEGIN